MSIIKNFVAPTLILGVICLIATLLLGITNDVTAPRIEEIAIQNEIESRQIVFPDAENFEVISQEDAETSIARALDKSGNTVGYIVVNAAKGYGGDIEVMTGVTTDGKVTGVNILSHAETAGLGAKATGEKFLNQFIGLIDGITVSKDKDGENSIDALTGATITSRAVAEAVNEAIKAAGGVNNG